MATAAGKAAAKTAAAQPVVGRDLPKIPDDTDEPAAKIIKPRFKCNLQRFSGADHDWESWKFNLDSFGHYYGLSKVLVKDNDGSYGKGTTVVQNQEFYAAVGASLEEKAIRVVRHVTPGDGKELIMNLMERYEPKQSIIRKDLLMKLLKPKFSRENSASLTDLTTGMEKAKHDLVSFGVEMPWDVLSFSLVEEMQNHSEFSSAKDYWIQKDEVTWGDICSVLRRMNSNFAAVKETDSDEVAAFTSEHNMEKMMM